MAQDSPEEGTPEPKTDRPARTKRRRRWRVALISSTGVVVLLALCIFVLPRYVVRYYVDNQLEQFGLTRTGIETIEIDMWNREILFGPVAIGKTGMPPARLARFALTFSLEALLDKRGFTPTVVIEGVDLEVTRAADGRLLINDMQIFEPGRAPGEATHEPDSGAPLGGWGFGLGSLSLRDSRVVFQEQAFQSGGTLVVEIDRLDLSEFQTWTPRNPGKVTLEAQVNDIAVTIEGTATPFADQISFAGESTVDGASFDKVERFTGPIPAVRAVGELTSQLKHEGTLKADGTLELSNAGKVTVSKGRLQFPEGLAMLTDGVELTFDMKNAISPDLSGHVSGHLGVAVGKLRADVPDGNTVTIDSFNLALKQIGVSRWLERGKPTVASAIEGIQLDANGVAFAGSTGETVDLDRLVTSIDRLQADQHTNGTLAIEANGAVDVTKLAARIPPLDGAAGGRLDVERIALRDLSAQLKLTRDAPVDMQASLSAEVDGIAAQLADGKPLKATAKRITLEEASHDTASGLTAKALRLFGLEAAIDQSIAAALSLSEKDDADEKPFDMPIRLDEVGIGDVAQLRYTDAPGKTPVTINARIDTLRLTGLDTTGAPAELTLDATINEFTPLRVSGTVSPFAPTPRFNLKAEARNLPLSQYSPYVEKYAGLFVERGALTIGGDGSVSEQGALDARLTIDMQNLHFASVSPERARELAARTGGLDPNAAANWLEDSQGKIELTIPIRGDLNEPQFDFEQVVSRAISGAIRATVSKTLKIIFPPALLISALQDASSGIAVRPVIHAPLGAGTDSTDENLLSALGELLRKRPRLGINVCGLAVKADFDAFIAARVAELRGTSGTSGSSEAERRDNAAIASRLRDDPVIVQRARDELTILAHERTRVVRRELTETHGIDAGRIGECRAAYIPEDAGDPRTAIRF